LEAFGDHHRESIRGPLAVFRRVPYLVTAWIRDDDDDEEGASTTAEAADSHENSASSSAMAACARAIPEPHVPLERVPENVVKILSDRLQLFSNRILQPEGVLSDRMAWSSFGAAVIGAVAD